MTVLKLKERVFTSDRFLRSVLKQYADGVPCRESVVEEEFAVEEESVVEKDAHRSDIL